MAEEPEIPDDLQGQVMREVIAILEAAEGIARDYDPEVEDGRQRLHTVRGLLSHCRRALDLMQTTGEPLLAPRITLH